MATNCILTRITRISRRSFASVAVEASLSMVSIPTRHSRHDPPPACLSSAQLKDVSEEVMGSKPGTLIPYEASKRDDSLHAWEVADESIQKVEWLIRGYSAQVNNTKMQMIYSNHKSNDSNDDPALDPAHCIKSIQELMQKMDTEGKMYMDLRHQMRSQLALEDHEEYERKDPLLGTQSDIDIHNHSQTSTPQVFAPPGQTIGMFDTLLDTMPMATNIDTPKTVGGLLHTINERFGQDGGIQYNVNPNTVPTQMTFNAGLRAIANTQNKSESTRDDAIMYAFGTFEALRDSNVKRNAATYAYMLQIVKAFFPPSEMAANISHALWLLAKEDQVIDTNVMKAMELVQCGNSENYQHFLNETIRDKTVDDIPHRWRKFGKSLRFAYDDDTY